MKEFNMIPLESITTGETYGEWPEAEVEELKLAMTKAFGVAYISGPMSGLPELNYPAFFAAEDRIKDQYSKVLNPARLALGKGQKNTWENWMRKAIPMMMEATHVVLLPGWKKSKGARIEVILAKILKMTVAYPREN